MRLVDILSEDLVVPAVKSAERDGLLKEVVDQIARARPDVDRDAALRVLVDRERIGSTGVGNGFAIPHGKLPNLRGMVACFARSVSGVDFNSLDHQPAHLFLVLLAPEGAAGLHLKALARASRLFKDTEFRAKLMQEGNASELWGIIRAEDARLAKLEC
ncbi:MAG: PTS sugar transporter subunit IIA [Myxococcota bacterium]